MSSAVARPIRSSSKKLTSSKTLPAFSGWCTTYLALWAAGGRLLRAVRLDPCASGPRPPCMKLVTPAVGRRSHLFDAARLAAGQGDAQPPPGPGDGLVGLAPLDRQALAGEHLDVQAQGLHLLDEHLERLGDSRLRDVLALDDRLVDLDPAQDVVRLDGQQLLEGVGGAVGLQGPHLHLAEPLAAELGLTAQ